MRIEWNGGKSPVPSGTRVITEYRDGDVSEWVDPGGESSDWLWEHNGDDCDIVAYKVVENA